jgi:predicted ATPase
MLNRIRIRGYKSLRDVEVRLEPMCVLMGPNAAGKSNFLDALQLLSRIVDSRTLKEAFEPPYRGKPLESFTFGPDGMDTLLAQTSVKFSIEADVELSPALIESVNKQIREMRTGKSEPSDEDATGNGKHAGLVREKRLRYRIDVEILPKSGILRVADEYLAALTPHGEPNNSRKPFLELMGSKLHLRMERQAHPTYYERYLDHSVLSLPLYPPHYPHLVAIRHELSRYFFFYFEPRERMRAPNPVKEVRHIGLMGENLAAFLNTLKALDEKQFRAVEKALHYIVPSITGIDVDVNSLGEVDLWLFEGKIRTSARIVSEGTLRVLGLLALTGAKDSPTLIGFEEPENGIHPRRVRMIAELLKTRAAAGKSQLLVTTHSPLLADMLPQKSLYVCKRVDGFTDISPLDTWGPLGRRSEIDEAMDDAMPPSERILRGDFDA